MSTHKVFGIVEQYGYGYGYSNTPEAQTGEDGFAIVAGKKKKHNANLK